MPSHPSFHSLCADSSPSTWYIYSLSHPTHHSYIYCSAHGVYGSISCPLGCPLVFTTFIIHSHMCRSQSPVTHALPVPSPYHLYIYSLRLTHFTVYLTRFFILYLHWGYTISDMHKCWLSMHNGGNRALWILGFLVLFTICDHVIPARRHYETVGRCDHVTHTLVDRLSRRFHRKAMYFIVSCSEHNYKMYS